MISERCYLKQIHPKKSLGQNFLVDNNILNKIIAAAVVSKKDTILEIGAGSGALTSMLIDNAREVFAVEIDSRLYSLLEERFANQQNIKLINKDILKINFSSLRRLEKLKVIANIPYYIATPIIEYLLNNRRYISEIFITIQKELADRIVAKPGSRDYSSLSCFVQFYTEPKKLFTIKKNSFLPCPKIDSCFLRLKVFKNPIYKLRDEKFLFEIIRSAFQMRRKTLYNSLSRIVDKELLKNALTSLAIDIKARPEQLSLEDFVELKKYLDKKT